MGSPFKTFRPISEAERAELEADQVMNDLRRSMAEVATLEQLEAIVASGEPEARDSIRTLITPMLRRDTPCCATAWRGTHTAGCPGGGTAAKPFDHDDDEVVEG